MHNDFSGLEILGVLVALLISLAILFRAQWIGETLGIIDRPDNVRKIHAHATPLVGGLAMMVPLLLSAVASLAWPIVADHARIALAVLVCGGGAALVGLIDDRSSTSPAARLMALLALTVAALVVSPQLLPAQFAWGHLEPTHVSPWLAYVLVAIGMAGFVNAVNMADGQDGCVAGMFAIWSGCIILVSGGASAGLAAVLFATSLCVLAFNLRGAVFLGGAGAYGVTFVVGLLILHLHVDWGVTAETIIVWFFVPIVDCLRLMIARPLHGRSPFDGDRNHFHHRLHDRFGKNEGLAIYLGIVAASSLTAALAPGLAPSCLVALAVVYAGLMWITTKSVDRAAAESLPRD